LRLISYDRPGYGGSAPQPGRSVADCAADVRAICAALGIERLGMWGISGGGPHVLACAALLPDLVAAAASLASPALWGAEGLDNQVADLTGFQARSQLQRVHEPLEELHHQASGYQGLTLQHRHFLVQNQQLGVLRGRRTGERRHPAD
jgi:pimeloyl-ACP methyl ester carboxylesterase